MKQLTGQGSALGEYGKYERSFFLLLLGSIQCERDPTTTSKEKDQSLESPMVTGKQVRAGPKLTDTWAGPNLGYLAAWFERYKKA